jgi:hypothetical protein
VRCPAGLAAWPRWTDPFPEPAFKDGALLLQRGQGPKIPLPCPHKVWQPLRDRAGASAILPCFRGAMDVMPTGPCARVTPRGLRKNS